MVCSEELFAAREKQLPEHVGFPVACVDWFDWDPFPVPSYPGPARVDLGNLDFYSAVAGDIHYSEVPLPVF